ncbi:MAG: hypothetical protein ACXVHV_08595 [Methanobacterium sp.]
MKKIAIILALMLILGAVFISGCATPQNNTSGNSSGQKNSSGIPGYSTAQIVNIGSENIVSEPAKTIET